MQRSCSSTGPTTTPSSRFSTSWRAVSFEITAVGHSLRDLVERQGNTTVRQANVTAVDLEAREVRFDSLGPTAYDYLVFCLGAQVNFFGTEGAAEHAFPMNTLPNAIRLRTTCSSGGRLPTRTRASSRTVR